MKLRYKVLTTAAVLLGVFIWGRYGKKVQTVPPAPSVLPSNDKEQIIVDPSHNSLIIKQPGHTETLTLPDRQSVIDIHKDGTVKVTSPQFGFEHHFFAGITVADKSRFGVGVDGLYYKRLDLGIGLADQLGSYTPVGFVKLSYNIVGGLQAGVVYQTNQYIGAALTVRLF